MNKHFQIQGAGGGGGGKGGGRSSRTPIEADDSLQSEQFAHVLDLLCEGEIEGLDDGTKSIFLDDTPVSNADGSYNFQNFVIVTRNGTQAQSYIPVPAGAGNIEVEQSVGVKVENGTPITRQITDTDVDRARVTINVPALQRITDEGDILGNSVSLRIDIQYNGGGFNTYLSDTISGKSSSLYQRDYLIEIDGSFPVDIRVIRTSANESSTKKSSDIFWSAYTEIQDDKLRYPNSALMGLRFSAKQFSSVPTRKYLIRGMKVKIPSNATVDTTTHLGRITYSGTWDGTFQAATWTNDPAWCLYDLLIDQRRYGVGVDESTLDKFDFFSVSQYCNALVDDGKGGQEPRFSLNILINSRDEVYNVIQQLTSVFRGIAYYGAGSLVLRQDKPTDAQYLLGPSNVVDGLFTYTGTAEKTRHTCATVGWQTYDNLGEVEYEYVEDADAVAKYGIINKDIRALGCYSQGQAHRLGKWTLLSEKNITESCSFAVAIDSGIVITPGMVVDIADPLRAGTRRSGRVSSATTTVITVDSDTSLSVNLSNSPTISVMMPTGLVETKTIDSISGTAITVSDAFSEAPNAAAVWLIQTSDIQSQQFRVVSVADNNDGTVGVTALAYNESIYNAVEQDVSLTPRDITNLSGIPAAPEGLNGTEFLYQEGQTVHTGFDLSWSHSRLNVNEFEVKYRLDDDNFIQVTTAAPSITLRALRAGTLTVQIIAKNYLGKQSATASATFTLLGKTAVPADVQNLSIEPISANSARLRWDQTVDLDVKVNGLVHVKHSNLTDGSATWPNSVDLIPAVAGNSTEAIIPLVEGEVLVKFEDELGNKSTNATSVLMDFPDAVGSISVQTRREDQDTPPFQGTKTDCFYSDDLDALVIDGDDNFDDVTDVDAITSFDFLGDILSSAEYQFANTLDLGAKYALDIKRRFVTRAFFPNDTIDARTALIDTWNDFDGTEADAVNAKFYMRRTDDDPSGSPTYTGWQEIVAGTFVARAFQFKAELSSADIAQNILVDQLGYETSFQRREEISQLTASGTSTKSITFDNAFFVGTSALGNLNNFLPSIGITVQNLGDGERVNVSSVTGTGFNLDVLDSNGNNVDRNFTYTAVGFGRGV
jgi:predicted phage tail protein